MKAARFANKHFEAVSWVFTLMLFVSLGYSAYGMYNLATVGTCDPANPDSCVFNPHLPECGVPECTGDDHCFCDGVEVHCSDPLFVSCEGDCECVCDALEQS